MNYTNQRMTGEYYVEVTRDERIRLNNKPIDGDKTTLFLKWQNVPAKVEFSNRTTKYRWGTTWQKRKRIVLYRHSVWVFLHELAHLVAPQDNHGPDFGVALRGLYLQWLKLEA